MKKMVQRVWAWFEAISAGLLWPVALVFIAGSALIATSNKYAVTGSLAVILIGLTMTAVTGGRFIVDELPRLLVASFHTITGLTAFLTFLAARVVAAQLNSDVNPAFFELSAQVLPVLGLAVIIDIRASQLLSNAALAAPLLFLVLAEMLCLNVSAGIIGPSWTGYSLVIAAYGTGAVALILGLIPEPGTLRPGDNVDRQWI